MIVPTPEGRRIVEYAGLVPGGAATGANIFRDPFAVVRNIVGACEGVPQDAHGATIGVDLDEEVPGDRGRMLMVSANGMAAGWRRRGPSIWPFAPTRDEEVCRSTPQHPHPE